MVTVMDWVSQFLLRLSTVASESVWGGGDVYGNVLRPLEVRYSPRLKTKKTADSFSGGGVSAGRKSRTTGDRYGADGRAAAGASRDVVPAGVLH